MDGLDSLISEISTKKALDKRGKSSKKSFRTESQWDDWEDESEIERKKGSENDARVEIIMCQVKSLLIGLTDDLVREKLKNQLMKLKFHSFIEYYQKNSSLSEYTIHTELHRMDFKIIYQNEIYDEKNEVLNIYKQIPDNILWRLANQSIYAELILLLQTNFPIQELNLSLISNKSTFIINFDIMNIIAESIFSFQCINHSQNTSNNLHNLAEIHGLVDVSIPDKTIYHKLYSPKLQILFDDKLRDIANSIAILQDASSTLTSTSDFEDSDSNNNNNMNQFSSLLSIRNDLLLNSDIKQSLERSKLLLTNASDTALIVGSGFLEQMVVSVGTLLGAAANIDSSNNNRGNNGNGQSFPATFPRPPPTPPPYSVSTATCDGSVEGSVVVVQGGGNDEQQLLLPEVEEEQEPSLISLEQFLASNDDINELQVEHEVSDRMNMIEDEEELVVAAMNGAAVAVAMEMAVEMNIGTTVSVNYYEEEEEEENEVNNNNHSNSNGNNNQDSNSTIQIEDWDDEWE